MRKRITVALLSIGLVCIFAAAAHSQTTRTSGALNTARRLPLVGPTLRDTSYVNCWDPKLSKWRSKFGRSAVLTSNNRQYRAYVEVEATAFEALDAQTYRGPSCANISTLFVAGPNQRNFRAAYIQLPEAYLLGNGLRLVSWSPNGRELLIEVVQWQYESDVDVGRRPLLYDAEFGTVTDFDLLILAKTLGFSQDCRFSVSARGFSANSEPVIEVLPVNLTK